MLEKALLVVTVLIALEIVTRGALARRVAGIVRMLRKGFLFCAKPKGSDFSRQRLLLLLSRKIGLEALFLTGLIGVALAPLVGVTVYMHGDLWAGLQYLASGESLGLMAVAGGVFALLRRIYSE